jgi:MoaA/NifB/PqqE/SkfB family radical SAM enzyme
MGTNSKVIMIKVDNGQDLASLTYDPKNLKGKFCSKPFETLSVRDDGSCWMCCTSWLPYSIGNLNEQSFDEIWHGEVATTIRNSILDGSFRYCNHTVCGDISENRLENLTGEPTAAEFPTHIMFENDSSCNLSCPSCRTEKIYDYEGPDYDRKLALHNKIINAVFSEPHDKEIILDISGGGDPFGSKIFRDFLINFDPTPWPNLKLDLQTNGVMLTPTYWRRIKKWHSKIRAIRISFDAGCEETYDIVRRGGNWKTLLTNCDYINSEILKNPNVYVLTQFVVQDLNYKEMKDYANLILSRYPNFYYVEFQLVIDWGTWSKDIYNQRTIWKIEHPEYTEFKKILKDPVFSNPKVRLGNVANVLIQET